MTNGYYMSRIFFTNLAGTDPGTSPELFPASCFTKRFRLYRWKLSGTCVTAVPNIMPALALVDFIINPHPVVGSQWIDQFKVQCPLPVGTIQQIDLDKDYGEEGRLFNLDWPASVSPLIGLVDVQGGATNLNCLLEMWFGNDLNPQADAAWSPGPL